jgi:hypothetical protein
MSASRHNRPFQNRSLCERSEEPSNLTPDRIVELLDVIGRICASLASGEIRFPLNASAFQREETLQRRVSPDIARSANAADEVASGISR